MLENLHKAVISSVYRNVSTLVVCNMEVEKHIFTLGFINYLVNILEPIIINRSLLNSVPQITFADK